MNPRSPSELVTIGVAITVFLAGIWMASSFGKPSYPHGPRAAVSVKAVSKLGAVVVPPGYVLPTIGSE